MVFSRTLDKTYLLYTERTDNTESSLKRRKKVRSIRAIRVRMEATPDLEKAMAVDAGTLDFLYGKL